MSIGPPGDDTWIRDERAHEREMAEIASQERYAQRMYRKEVLGWVITAVAIVAVVGILAGLIWWAVGNSTRANTERDRICAESGGTRTTVGNGSATLCLHLAPEVPQ